MAKKISTPKFFQHKKYIYIYFRADNITDFGAKGVLFYNNIYNGSKIEKVYNESLDDYRLISMAHWNKLLTKSINVLVKNLK